ncbi:MAG: AmmeMemoRadiSam system protein B [Candidatus Geothermincolales bacterium]
MKEGRGIMGGCIVPHPPLLVPEIGGRDLERVRSTREAMLVLGNRLRALEPETLVMISPHTPVYRDAFVVRTREILEGDFSSFGRPEVRIRKENDVDLVSHLIEAAEGEGFPLYGMDSGYRPGFDQELDHGLLVPLYYLDQFLETPIVTLSISFLDYQHHFRLGRLVKKVCEERGRKAFFVASGDLSHRLIRGAPAGYSPKGAEFDRRIVEIAGSGDFDALYRLDEDLVEEAGECGLRSIHAMWGALKDGELKNEVLSYEGPFGVGYMVSLHLLVEGGGR